MQQQRQRETKIELKGDSTALRRARTWLDGLVAVHGVGDTLKAELELVLEEALVNIIQHGYAGSQSGDQLIQLRAVLTDDELMLEFRDRGVQFNPLECDDPNLDVAPDERAIGGLGIYLIKQLVDELEYVRHDGANHLRVHKKINL